MVLFYTFLNEDLPAHRTVSSGSGNNVAFERGLSWLDLGISPMRCWPIPWPLNLSMESYKSGTQLLDLTTNPICESNVKVGDRISPPLG